MAFPVFSPLSSRLTKFLAPAALLVIRCYALYQRKRWVLLITVPLGLAVVGISLVRHTFPNAVPISVNDTKRIVASG